MTSSTQTQTQTLPQTLPLPLPQTRPRPRPRPQTPAAAPSTRSVPTGWVDVRPADRLEPERGVAALVALGSASPTGSRNDRDTASTADGRS